MVQSWITQLLESVGKKKASDILSNLKKGGGFEGTTPRFMIQAGELDIDKKIKKIPGYSN